MAELPAWSGAVGSTLVKSADAFLQGMMGPSFEDERAAREEARLKAEAERRRIESQTKLYEAEALYNARRKSVGGRLYKVGNNLVQDNEEGKPEVVYEGPAKEPNELERLRGAARAHMERIIGRKYGLTTLPMEAWKDEDWDDPTLDKLRDFAGVGRSPLTTYPGGGGDVGPRRDVPGYGGRPGAPKSPPAKTEGATPVPSDTGTPTTSPPVKAPPVKALQPNAQLAPRPGTAAANEQAVLIRIPAFEAMKDEDLAPAIVALKKRQQLYPSPSTMADIEAAERVATRRRDQRITQSGVSPGTTEPQPSTPPTTEPPPLSTEKTAPPTRQRNMPLTKEQQEEEGRKRDDQRLQREQSARDAERLQIARDAEARNRLGAGTNNEQNAVANKLYVDGLIDSPTYNDNRNPLHKKLVDDYIREPRVRRESEDAAAAKRAENRDERAQVEQERRNRIELTGPVSPDQSAITNKLFMEGKIKQRHYALNDPEDQELVNKEIRDPKLRTEHLQALKLARPMMDELAMLENTQYLSRQIIPLLKRENLGLGGKVTNFSNWAWQYSPGYKEGFLAKAEKQIEAEGLGPGLDAALVEARATAMMEGTDPQIMNTLYYRGGRSRLETLVALLMYSHAMAQKRIGAGTARGITAEDMKEARGLFDITEFFSTPDKMKEKLVALQQSIQRAKTRKEAEVRQTHIDPKTGNLIIRKYYQEEGETPAGETAPVPESPEDRVRRGPQRKKE